MASSSIFGIKNLRDLYNRILLFTTKNLRFIQGDLSVSGKVSSKRPVMELSSGTTKTLSGGDSGSIIMINNAFSSGFTLTLPEDTAANIGFHCTVLIAVTQTGTFKIATANDGDRMFGAIHAQNTSAANAHVFNPGGASDNLVFDADTKGRLAGSVYRITYVAANKILVEGHAVGSGTLATPFSNS